MHKILVSYCLMGGKVRYHGGDAFCDHDILRQWGAEGRLVPLCPEVAAGNSIPRPPSEIVGQGGGEAVLNGNAKIMHQDGEDVTDFYLPGVEIALNLVQEHNIKMAVLKSGSPSCGNVIYDGGFTGDKIKQFGVVAYRLTKYGVKVFNEIEIELAREYFQYICKNSK